MTRAALLALLLAVACSDKKPAAAPDASLTARVADAAPSMAQPPPPDGGRGGGKPTPAEVGDAAVQSVTPVIDGGAAAAPAGNRPTGKSVGVDTCDEYLDKMAKCIAKLSPESAEPLRAAMEDTRRAWQDTAATPEGKATLSDSCRSALDAAKSAAKAMGCSW